MNGKLVGHWTGVEQSGYLVQLRDDGEFDDDEVREERLAKVAGIRSGKGRKGVPRPFLAATASAKQTCWRRRLMRR